MTQAISSTNVGGFAGELAVLLLENEASQAQTSRLQRDAARESYLDQGQQQVDALHAAASATRSGALLSASLSIAGGACQIAAAGCQFQAAVGPSQGACLSEVAADQQAGAILDSLGSTSSKLADPLKSLVGDSAAEDHQAQAKQHELFAAQAQWQASDASTAIDKANKQADKVLDLVQGISRDQNSATNALIGRI